MEEFKLYLGRETKGGVKASVELIFELEEILEDNGILDLVNSAPIFTHMESLDFEFLIDGTISNEEKSYKVKFETKLSKIDDDEQSLAEVKIKSDTLGNAIWKNETGVVH